MTIPEVTSRGRLIDFLKKYFALKGEAGGGSGAPTTAQYIVRQTDSSLSRERVITAGANIAFTDAGDGGAFTIAASGGVDVSGTPSNNQIATFTDSDTIQGESNLTFDGSTLTVTGDASITGNTTLGNANSDTVTLNGVAAGVDNTVLVLNSSNVIKTDEIDSRVWGSTLVDASGTPADNQVGIWTDANTMEGSSNLTFDGTDLTVANDLILGSEIIHSGDTDTKIGFTSNTQTYTCGNSERLKLNSTGVGLMGATPIAGLAVTGDLTISGDTTLGNASGDSLTINAQTINPANIAAGTDNTVVVYNGSSLVTDEIDSRVWGSSLVDVTGTPSDNQIAVWTDADTVEGTSNLTFNGTQLYVGGDIQINGNDIKGSSGNVAIRITESDNIQMAQRLTIATQPSFLVYLTANQTISSDNTYTTIQFTGEAYDTNNDFASYRFTAPVAGKYLFSANARIDSIPAKSTQWVQGKIRNITTGQEFSVGLVDLDGGADYHTVTGTVVMKLGASEAVDFQVAVKDVDGTATRVFGQSTVDGFHRTYFSGYLLG